MSDSSPAPTSPRLVVILAFVLLLGAFEVIFGPFLPLENGFVGDDYSLTFPALLDGYVWFRNNGLAPPWFSPAFCAGQPFFADPQSGYYSLPQFLSFVVSPLAAVHLLMLICAASLFWGGYLLMRKVFAAGPTVAVLVGGLLMFNGFLPHRMLIGHLGYHGFALIPWLALLLLVPVRNRVNGVAAGVVAGILLAYWVHSAFGTLMLAGGLAIILIALIYALSGGSIVRFATRGALATIIGLGLSASKLWAAYSFLSHFPRTFYSLPGAGTILDAMTMIAGMLFLPSQLAYSIGMPRIANVQWALAPHEWAFNFGTIVALLVILLAAYRLRRLQWTLPPRRQALLGTLLLLGLIWPLAFNVWQPEWNAFLKTIPFLNSASTPLRWVIVYIPIIAVGLGLLLERANWGRLGTATVVIALVATVGQSAFEPRGYYLSQGYDAHPVLFADEQLREGKWVPSIKELGTVAPFQIGDAHRKLKRNDTLIAGVSQLFCYNPSFGYRLEKFSADGLRLGSVMAEQNGFLNIKNPACYVYPETNHCRPGDRFRADQLAAAKSFAEYRPYNFEMSTGQMMANRVTLAMLLAVAAAVLAWLWQWLACRQSSQMD